MSKCYFAHGGNELVIGGKLTFLPGSSVEGAEGLLDLPAEAAAPETSRTQTGAMMGGIHRSPAAGGLQSPACRAAIRWNPGPSSGGDPG